MDQKYSEHIYVNLRALYHDQKFMIMRIAFTYFFLYIINVLEIDVDSSINTLYIHLIQQELSFLLRPTFPHFSLYNFIKRKCVDI